MSVAIFAYFGPETVLPLTSVVAAVAGVVLMFGRNAVRLAARCLRIRIPGRKPSAAGRPHLGGRERTRSDSQAPAGPSPTA